MLAGLVESRMAANERRIGVSFDWMRKLYRTAPRAFWRFIGFMPLAGHRRAASVEAIAVARLVGVLSEDCGPCVQFTVNAARLEGVAPEVLRAVLDDRALDLSPELSLAMAYAKSIVHHDNDMAMNIELVRVRLGEAVLAELALAVASARVFPTVKRGLGYDIACSKVTIEVTGAASHAHASSTPTAAAGGAMNHG